MFYFISYLLDPDNLPWHSQQSPNDFTAALSQRSSRNNLKGAVRKLPLVLRKHFKDNFNSEFSTEPNYSAIIKAFEMMIEVELDL